MPQQLTLFNLWEDVPEPKPAPAPPPPPEPLPVPVLRGQQALFGGSHVGETAVDAALGALDPKALRAAEARTRRDYPTYAPARQWPTWANSLETLGKGAARSRLKKIDALGDPVTLDALFPDMRPDRLAMLVGTLQVAAIRGVLVAEGPAAKDRAGIPLADDLRRQGHVAEALALAAKALETDVGDVQLWLCAARCHVALHHDEPARNAWLGAALVQPRVVAQAADLPPELADLIEDADEAELPGKPADWLAALADLSGLWRLPPPEATPPCAAKLAEAPGLRFAKHLAALRAIRRQGSAVDAAAVRAVKAALLGIAPGLKERIRRV